MESGTPCAPTLTAVANALYAVGRLALARGSSHTCPRVGVEANLDSRAEQHSKVEATTPFLLRKSRGWTRKTASSDVQRSSLGTRSRCLRHLLNAHASSGTTMALFPHLWEQLRQRSLYVTMSPVQTGTQLNPGHVSASGVRPRASLRASSRSRSKGYPEPICFLS